MILQVVFQRSGWVIVVAIALFAVGCGEKQPAKFHVSGKVTLDGEPVKEGYVIFYPTDNGHDADTAPISSGKYELRAFPGSKKVEITANRPMVPEKLGPLGTPETEQYIPSQYNKSTELTGQVEKKKNVIDFTLKSK